MTLGPFALIEGIPHHAYIVYINDQVTCEQTITKTHLIALQPREVQLNGIPIKKIVVGSSGSLRIFSSGNRIP